MSDDEFLPDKKVLPGRTPACLDHRAAVLQKCVTESVTPCVIWEYLKAKYKASVQYYETSMPEIFWECSSASFVKSCHESSRQGGASKPCELSFQKLHPVAKRPCF